MITARFFLRCAQQRISATIANKYADKFVANRSMRVAESVARTIAAPARNHAVSQACSARSFWPIDAITGIKTSIGVTAVPRPKTNPKNNPCNGLFAAAAAASKVASGAQGISVRPIPRKNGGSVPCERAALQTVLCASVFFGQISDAAANKPVNPIKRLPAPAASSRTNHAPKKPASAPRLAYATRRPPRNMKVSHSPFFLPSPLPIAHVPIKGRQVTAQAVRPSETPRTNIENRLTSGSGFTGCFFLAAYKLDWFYVAFRRFGFYAVLVVLTTG